MSLLFFSCENHEENIGNSSDTLNTDKIKDSANTQIKKKDTTYIDLGNEDLYLDSIAFGMKLTRWNKLLALQTKDGYYGVLNQNEIFDMKWLEAFKRLNN